MKLGLLLLILLSGCQDYNSNSSDKEKYGQVQLENNAQFRTAYGIIQNRCVNCHTYQGHSVWADYTTNAEWIASGLIIKGDPRNSRLIYRIKNSGQADSDMPLGGSALPDSEYDALVEWVENIP